MFKYISKIIAQFSTPQKIIALSMLLLAIIIISIAPSLISSITLDREELNKEIERQEGKIQKLETDVDSLEGMIRKNEKECTNQIVSREEEFVMMLDQLKGDIRKNNNSTQEKIVKLNSTVVERKIYPVSDSSVSMMMVIPEERTQEKIIVYKKPQINSTLSLIDEMKKRIKKN
jgi:septal ring factor EnvC (AmiA/AmiB activator)